MIIDQVLSNNEIIIQKGENFVSDMDGEKIILSIQNGKYYNLGEIGGEIWERIRDSISIQELITTLVSEYDVERSQCEEQVLTFVKKLVEEDLIEILV